MPEVPERRRKTRQKPTPAQEPVWVLLHNVPGAATAVRAKVVDKSELGFGVETDVRLEPTAVLAVEGQGGVNGFLNGSHGGNGSHLGNGSNGGKIRARVVDCRPFRGGFRASLLFESEGRPTGSSAASPEAVPDHYELLQISPNADPDMIHRVYRLLAQRYHPDNTITGDDKAFRALTEAYAVLSDPEKRASYDINLHAYRQVRWRIFDHRQAAMGKVAEKSKRKGILDLLYTQRANEPEKPSMNLHELEELLGCPREHLEFSLWYLKENGLVTRMDNGRFAVTAKGVDWAEQEEASERLRSDRLIEAASSQHPGR